MIFDTQYLKYMKKRMAEDAQQWGRGRLALYRAVKSLTMDTVILLVLADDPARNLEASRIQAERALGIELQGVLVGHFDLELLLSYELLKPEKIKKVQRQL